MTTLTQPAAQPSSESARRVTQAKVVRSEWTKFRTQPSTAWSLLATVALIVGFGVLYSLVRVTRPPRSPAEVVSFDPTAIGLAGVQLAQIAVGVLGVLLVTSEYATGMIRTSMVAVPRRLPVLWARPSWWR
jgi:ABC-2 type transport system permease protein